MHTLKYYVQQTCFFLYQAQVHVQTNIRRLSPFCPRVQINFLSELKHAVALLCAKFSTTVSKLKIFVFVHNAFSSSLLYHFSLYHYSEFLRFYIHKVMSCIVNHLQLKSFPILIVCFWVCIYSAPNNHVSKIITALTVHCSSLIGNGFFFHAESTWSPFFVQRWWRRRQYCQDISFPTNEKKNDPCKRHPPKLVATGQPVISGTWDDLTRVPSPRRARLLRKLEKN
jgi:hypothetical protein